VSSSLILYNVFFKFVISVLKFVAQDVFRDEVHREILAVMLNEDKF